MKDETWMKQWVPEANSFILVLCAFCCINIGDFGSNVFPTLKISEKKKKKNRTIC